MTNTNTNSESFYSDSYREKSESAHLIHGFFETHQIKSFGASTLAYLQEHHDSDVPIISEKQAILMFEAYADKYLSCHRGQTLRFEEKLLQAKKGDVLPLIDMLYKFGETPLTYGWGGIADSVHRIIS